MVEELQSKNIFIYDKPIGRKQFLINMLLILSVSLPFIISYTLILAAWGINIYTRPILICLSLILGIIMLYLNVLNYSKRFYDIINDKKRAILYVILYYVGLNAMSFIPFLKMATFLLGVSFIALLIFKKGQVLNFEASQNSDTAQNSEENNNEISE